jgi:hypothetical protein
VRAARPELLDDHPVGATSGDEAPGEAAADEPAALAIGDAQPSGRNEAMIEVVKAPIRQAILAG